MASAPLRRIGRSTSRETAGEPSALMRSSMASASMSALSLQRLGSLPGSGGASESLGLDASAGKGQKSRDKRIDRVNADVGAVIAAPAQRQQLRAEALDDAVARVPLQRRRVARESETLREGARKRASLRVLERARRDGELIDAIGQKFCRSCAAACRSTSTARSSTGGVIRSASRARRMSSVSGVALKVSVSRRLLAGA